MFSSRIFIILLIPVIFLALGIWTFLSTDVDHEDVRVAGTLISNAEVDIKIKTCTFSEREGARNLVLELESKNHSADQVRIIPNDFCVVLARGGIHASDLGQRVFFSPLFCSSTCEAAPDSVSVIPPGAVRSMTLVFPGDTMPRGSEWEDHILSLEYYDEFTPLIISTVLNPPQE